MATMTRVSAMWTEVATGAEARGVRRWGTRAAVHRVIRWLAVLMVVLAMMVIWERTMAPKQCLYPRGIDIVDNEVVPAYFVPGHVDNAAEGYICAEWR